MTTPRPWGVSSAGTRRATNGRPPQRQSGLMWVEAPPPDVRGNRDADMDHKAIALALRSHPGRWAHLIGVASATAVTAGSAYRPAGSYEVVTRQGQVYARYIGGEGTASHA